MMKILVLINFVCSTIFFSTIAIIVSLFKGKGENAHKVARLWATFHLKVCGISVSLKGSEHIPKPPYIFMCNHQSALDIYTLHSSLPLSFKWIAKRELFSIPFLGWAMKRAGYISLDRKNPREAIKGMDEAARKIREGMNIIIFPEGTRGHGGALLPFKKGGFSLALRAKVPIVPVGIYGTSRLQPKGSFIPKEKGVIYINIGEPIHLEDVNRSEKTKIMLEVRTHIERLIACQEI